MIARLLLLLALSALLPSAAAAQAEAGSSLDRRLAVTLEVATRSASLIVHTRAERVENRVLFKVLDTLHGVLDPAMFQAKAPAGYLDLYRRDPVGSEKILFFQNDRAVRTFDWFLPVEGGMVTYQNKPLSLAEFRALLLRERPANAVPLPELAARSALILHCRTEDVDGKVYHRVLAVLKGTLAEASFTRPAPQGCINLGANLAGAELVLFFYGREKLSRQDAFFPIREGKVAYRGQSLGTESFLAMVRNAVRKE